MSIFVLRFYGNLPLQFFCENIDASRVEKEAVK
jgi:hypothetical protein